MLKDREKQDRDRWWLVVAAGVALFMGQLDATIVNVALPTLATAVTALCAVYGGALAIAGALGVLGLGAAFFAGPSQAASMSATPADRLGTTAATTSLARQLGVASGPALATTVWAAAGGVANGLPIALALTVPVCLLSAIALRNPRPLFAPAEGVVRTRKVEQ